MTSNPSIESTQPLADCKLQGKLWVALAKPSFIRFGKSCGQGTKSTKIWAGKYFRIRSVIQSFFLLTILNTRIALPFTVLPKAATPPWPAWGVD
jgi:hypothetical protein